MITGKLKTRTMALTTHNIGMLRIARRIQAKPEAARTDKERRFMADYEAEQQGMVTLGDLGAAKKPGEYVEVKGGAPGAGDAKGGKAKEPAKGAKGGKKAKA